MDNKILFNAMVGSKISLEEALIVATEAKEIGVIEGLIMEHKESLARINILNMKRAERQGDNIHVFNVDEGGQRVNEEIMLAGDYSANISKAVVSILYHEPEGYQLDMYDEETGSFNF